MGYVILLLFTAAVSRVTWWSCYRTWN